MDNMWIAGRRYEHDSRPWEIIGVFSTEEKAIEACIEPHDFVGPLEVDLPQFEDGIEWEGAYYPHATIGPEA